MFLLILSYSLQSFFNKTNLFSEIQHGIPIKSESGEVVGNSSNAAKIAISQVSLSRISMAVPGMS